MVCYLMLAVTLQEVDVSAENLGIAVHPERDSTIDEGGELD